MVNYAFDYLNVEIKHFMKTWSFCFKLIAALHFILLTVLGFAFFETQVEAREKKKARLSSFRWTTVRSAIPIRSRSWKRQDTKS